ncbi:MAG: Druantia anti-phage system protein DruA [Pseudomonadota bacterium]
MSAYGAEEREKLRARVLRSLRAQGFRIRSGRLVPPDTDDKQQLRELHAEAVRHQIERSREGLARHERRLLTYIASGSEISPERIRPRLVVVQPNSEDELLFRYARLHWSIPVSAGYGRRLRFAVYDDSNGKLMGVFGLGDPVFSLGPRDRWIGWTLAQRKARLQCVMDLFVLGAVPPYAQLLCGKLMAMLATSIEVRQAFRRKYGGDRAFISGKPLDGRLALLTTTSALGRSSLYNRLTFQGETVFHSLGYTQGSGEFHFGNGFYSDLRALAEAHCQASAKHARWGSGFRNRRELVRKALALLGLSRDLVYHGVQREIFAAPLASNTTDFLRGEHQRLRPFNRTAAELFAWFRERWLLPRAARDSSYRDFEAESYRLWSSR